MSKEQQSATMITQSREVQLDDLLVRICEDLQLTAEQHKRAESAYKGIGNWLDAPGSMLASARPSIYPQGSFRIQTTVRPLARDEFDLDLVCEFAIDPRKVPDPLTLLTAVEARLKEHGLYKSMLERKKRCIRVRYENEFHLDILPACPDGSSGNGSVLVPDREDQGWKHSSPKAFAAWFQGRATQPHMRIAKRIENLPNAEPVSEKRTLQLCTQLLKRWRDLYYKHAPEVSPISILLTTLAAQQYYGQKSVSTAFADIVSGIVNSIPPLGERLVVVNPTQPAEDFSERWGQDLAAR